MTKSDRVSSYGEMIQKADPRIPWAGTGAARWIPPGEAISILNVKPWSLRYWANYRLISIYRKPMPAGPAQRGTTRIISFYREDEIQALAKLSARYGELNTTLLRDLTESIRVDECREEAALAGLPWRRSGRPVEWVRQAVAANALGVAASVLGQWGYRRWVTVRWGPPRGSGRRIRKYRRDEVDALRALARKSGGLSTELLEGIVARIESGAR